ncbi:MAG: hypothetical protein PF574_09780 [Candidatus Delongbacteria bacterium]|jgi:hypothetical protein|nr:hypothetical protein [Candidatus Delongbacteria bacterium]
MKIIKLSLILSLLLFSINIFGQVVKTEGYTKKYSIDENGNKITIRKVAGYPPEKLPVCDYTPPKTMEKGIFFALDNVPGYSWSYGAMPTATAMLVGYYDHLGVEDSYIGTEGSGLAPMTNAVWISQASTSGTDENPIAATNQDVDGRDKKGHSDDYWTNYGDEGDPYYGNWAEHSFIETGYNTCTADFMGSNQWFWGNADGHTTLWSSEYGVYDYAGAEWLPEPERDGIHGLRLFWEALGYTVDINYNRTITGYNDPNDDPDEGPVTDGFTYEMLMNQINQGFPVIIQLEGHSMLGYGYDNTDEQNPKVIVRDTWSYDTSNTHVMPWGGLYSTMQHYGVSVFNLGTEGGWFAPQNVLALNNNRNVTVTWDDPSKGTENMNYEVYRDDVLQATVATEYFWEVFTATGDGLHTYYVKSIYVDEPYTTLPSLSSSVFVCASITEFHDDFESGDGQWNLSDGWGLDTDYFQSGTYSLSESPGGNYYDGTDQLPEGGSVAEIVAGLNFSAAADASLDFWFRYDIETSFDYMHLQTCKDGENWVSLKVWDGETPIWAQENISLGLYAGESNVRIRFLFVSDPGYNTEGANIDDINILPTTFDPSPPFVWYTKEKDYYDNNPDGFEIVAEIIDFSGIYYANVIYNVNGGLDQSVSPYQIIGDNYYFKIPEQLAGDLVEFKFDCQDLADPPGQGFTGQWSYIAGQHHKFDDGYVSYYEELVTTTDQYDHVAIANKFYSFQEDIVGVVIRGYDDVSQPDDNSDMLIHVWADNNGLPGAELITPLQVTNPATLAETNKWAYVDLSSYIELMGMAGDYYIGITCASGGPSDVTRSVNGVPADYGGYDYGKAYLQLYNPGLMWEKEAGTLYHIRAVTTNKKQVPPIIVADPSFLDKTVFNTIKTDNLTLTNSGGFDYDYTATFEYLTWPNMKTKADITVESNDFESGLVYMNNPGDWSVIAGQASVTTQGVSYLETPVFDGTVCTELYLNFDQNSVFKTGSYFNVEYSDNAGSSWTQIYNGTTSTSVSQDIAIPTVSSTMTIRFIGNLTKDQGSTASWQIDNVLVYGPEAISLNWLYLDNGSTTSDTVATVGSDVIEVKYDCTDPSMMLGDEYTAVIHITAPFSDPVDVPVSLFIMYDPIPPPLVVIPVIRIEGSNVVLEWEIGADGTFYDIYSSYDPYGTFTYLTSTAINEFIEPLEEMKYYYIITKRY